MQRDPAVERAAEVRGAMLARLDNIEKRLDRIEAGVNRINGSVPTYGVAGKIVLGGGLTGILTLLALEILQQLRLVN